MKKALLARGITGAVASLLGVVAIGCGADVGTEGEGASGSGEIGSVEQALTSSASVQDLANAVAPNGSGIDNPVGRHASAHCKFKIEIGDELVDLMFIHGGFNTAGAGLDEAFIYRPDTDVWTKVESITDMTGTEYNDQARGLGQMIELDDDDAAEENLECLYAGGTSNRAGGTLRTATFKVTLNSPTSVTYTKVGDLNAGRVLGGLMRCGNGVGSSARAIYFGGTLGPDDMGNPINSANSIEAWTGTAWTAEDAANPNEVLLPRVSAFAYAETDSHRKFAIAGGHDGTGAVADLQTFTVNDACTAVTKQSTGTLGTSANANIPQARFGGAALFAPGTNDLLVVAGSSGTALLTYAERFTPTFTGTGFNRAGILTGLTGARHPVPSSNGTQFVLVGGEVQAGTINQQIIQAPVNAAQEFAYAGGVWTHGTDTTFTARSFAAVEYLNSESKYYANSGLISVGPLTLTTITESIQ